MNKELSLYIHIPFCVRKCKYCDFLSMPASSEMKEEYVQALLMEIDSYRDTELAKRKIYTVFIGGGTPSVLEPEQITRIAQKIKSIFNICECEFTIEVNPGTVTKNACVQYKKAGINRISIGLQSTCDEQLKALGRIHDFAAFKTTYQNLRQSGFENINIDLMSALPGQTVEAYRQDLENVLELKPEHISAYSLIIEEGTELYTMYADDCHAQKEDDKNDLTLQAQCTIDSVHASKEPLDVLPFQDEDSVDILPLPNEDDERKMYQLTKQILEQYGYKRYEISNYAKDGYECRHNLVYWRRGEYLGLGLGSASFLANTRYKNTDNLSEYINLWKNATKPAYDEKIILSKEDQMAEYMYLGLRCMSGISMESFEEQFQTSVLQVYQKQIETYERLGLLIRYKDEETSQTYLALTEAGIDVSNHIFSEFLI